MHQTIQTYLAYFKKRLNKSLNIKYYQLKPNFLIPGSKRSGTTFLYYLLKTHPEIYLSEMKEPNFFTDNYSLGEKWYLQNFECLSHFKTVGEASTSYMNIKSAAKRIYDFNSEFKLIFMLRNPVNRAVSQYNRGIQMFGKPLPTKILLDIGKYSTQIERFRKYFPEDQLLFIIFEEFMNDLDKVSRRILQFLEVDTNFKPDLKNIYTNPSKVPINLKLQEFIGRNFKYTPKASFLKNSFDVGMWWFLNKINHLKTLKKFPKLSDSKRKMMKDYYLNEISKVEELLDIDLEIWK